MPSLFGGRKKAYVFNGTAAPNTKSCWSQVEESESAPQTSPRLSLAFGYGEEPPQPPSLPRMGIPRPPKLQPPSLPRPSDIDSDAKTQRLEQRSEVARKSKRPSSASRASAAVSAAWTAARAALNATVPSPRTSSQQKDSKGQKISQSQVDDRRDIDSKKRCPEASQRDGSRNGDEFPEKDDPTSARDDLNVLTNKLVEAVYGLTLTEEEVTAVLQSCPEVGWLAQCAQNAPTPVGWQRCGWLPGSDGRMVVCYTNPSTHEVKEVTPLLESFAELAKLALHAVVNTQGAANAAHWVAAARDKSLKEAAKSQESWSGPHVDETSAAEFYYCASTGESSWVSPAAAHAYVAHVAQQLLKSHIFPEHIDNHAPNEKKKARETVDRHREEGYPDLVNMRSGYAGEHVASREAESAGRKHSKQSREESRSRKARPSPAKSHGSRSVESDVASNTNNFSTGHGVECDANHGRRKQKHDHETRSRKPRSSPACSHVSESAHSDITGSSATSCSARGSSKHGPIEACNNAKFFEIYSGESADDLDENDSVSCASARPDRPRRRQKQKRRTSLGTDDSKHRMKNDSTSGNKAAAALAGAAAALSAAAVALAGLENTGTKEAIHVDSLLAAASALRGAGSGNLPTEPTMAEVNTKRPPKMRQSKAQPEIPRLPLESLANADQDPDVPSGDAATGRFKLASELTTTSLDDASDHEQHHESVPGRAIPGFPYTCEFSDKCDEPELPPSEKHSGDCIREEAKSKPSVLAPLPPAVRNKASKQFEGAAIDTNTLLAYAEEAAAGDTPTSSINSETIKNAERQEAIAVAESALQAAVDHASVSSRPTISDEVQQPDFTQCPQPVSDHVGKADGEQESRRKRVSVGGA